MEHQDQIVEGVQEDGKEEEPGKGGKEEEPGKGGQEEEAMHARGRPGAGRLIPAEGGIDWFRKARRGTFPAEGHTPRQ